MSQLASASISFFICYLACLSPLGFAESLSFSGWRLTADSQEATLEVAHLGLGELMINLRLNLETGTGLRPLDAWNVTQESIQSFLIKTVEPRTAWKFVAETDRLKISCTSSQGVITATIPASPDRIPARLIDRGGFPVDWVGTDEVKHSYGGDVTWNQSYLPKRNPEVMYFALGQVSNPAVHGLFDRKTDIAISFPSNSTMCRNVKNQNLLNLRLPLNGNALIRLTRDYFKTLGVPYYIPFDDSIFATAPAVWCSWTSYYADIAEQDIIENTNWLADHLKQYGFEYVQLDDGYDRGPEGEHYWIENWDQSKFPHGPEWLTHYIKSKGLKPGLWLVPNAYAGAVTQHPEWYLRYKDGTIVRDYNTPTLDSTNPEVLNFLRQLFTTLRNWGFEYYKFDGEHAVPKYAPGIDLTRLYDSKIEPLEAYRRRVEVIREAIGSHTFVEGCPAGTPLNAIGYYNSTFAGHDVYNSWQGMHPLFSSINANAFLNHMVVYLMPGEGIELGSRMTVEDAEKRRSPSVVAVARTREEPMRGFGATLSEARTLVSYVSLTGVVYPIASIMPELPEERVRLLKMTLPTMPILPTDLYSRGTDMTWNRFKQTQAEDYIHNYSEILDLKVNAASGVYDVLALTNWTSEAVSRCIELPEKLGLEHDSAYLVFDFWKQKGLGIVQDKLKLVVQPHDTRVLLIRPRFSRPQLLGTSRHITGAYSIRRLHWDDASVSLEGSSKTVPGQTYVLSIHVPAEFKVISATAAAGEKSKLPINPERTNGDTYKFSFQGQNEIVDWTVKFAERIGR